MLKFESKSDKPLYLATGNTGVRGTGKWWYQLMSWEPWKKVNDTMGRAFSNTQSVGNFPGQTTGFFQKYTEGKEKRNITYRLKEIRDIAIKSGLCTSVGSQFKQTN